MGTRTAEAAELDVAYMALMARFAAEGNDAGLRLDAAKLAHRMRSRLYGLASLKRDFTPEYIRRVHQGGQLVAIAADAADEELLKGFSQANVAQVDAAQRGAHAGGE